MIHDTIEVSYQLIPELTSRSSFEILEDSKGRYIVAVTGEIDEKHAEVRFYLDGEKILPAPEGFQAEWRYSQILSHQEKHLFVSESDDT